MPSLRNSLKRFMPKRGPLATPVGRRVILGILVLVLAAIPIVVQTPPIGLTEGAPAPRTYRANRTVQYVDEDATQAARDVAADSVNPVYVFDPNASSEGRQDVALFFDAALATQIERGVATTETVRSLQDQFGDFDAALIESVAALPQEQIRDARRSAEQLITTVLERRFTADEMPDAVSQMRGSAQNLPYDGVVRDLVADVVEGSMRPTLVLDDAATEAARSAAADNVDPIAIVKQSGENIVQKGEIVTNEHLEIIRRLGLLEQVGSALSMAALVALCALAVAAAAAYLWRYDSEVWEDTRILLIVASLFLGMLWVTRLSLWFWPEVSPYLLPTPLAAMFATLLISAREGLLVAVLTTIGGMLLGLSGGANIVAMLTWSIIAVVATSFMTERRQLFYVGVFLLASGAVTGFVATLASGATSEALTAAGWGALGGMLAAVLGWGLLPFLEHLFDVTTDVRLLELGNPANPLLRRLMVEAPGTYSHSVMTGNLAEAAAEAIGANRLLARVGAYYHDVGKMRRAGFFVENQGGGENPHDNTSPTLSALIITAHVREGVELAEKHRLPREIIDIIQQHHGTSLVSYFFNKASEGDGPVYEADFRYDGQKPQSREAALVMLADSSEAAVRAIKKPSQARIEAGVRRIVDAKVADGQLDDADLTLADIERIIKTYAKMLASVYHPRIEYPDAVPRRSEHARPHHESPRS